MRRRRWLAVAMLLAAAYAGVTQAAERVVTLAPHLAELVCAVNACRQLVGVSAHTDAPAQVATLPQIGSAYAVNLEAVLALQPTRVLAWGGGTPPAAIARLRQLGLKVEVVSIDDLDGIAEVLQSLGDELGHAEEGDAAAGLFRDRLAALRARYQDRPRLRAFYQIESAPAYTINGGSPISAALDLCGADNVFASLPGLSSVVSSEAVLAADPDVVVYAQDEDRRGLDAYWRKLASARAADPSRQVVVDARLLTRAAPGVLDGIAGLCEGLDRVRRDAR